MPLWKQRRQGQSTEGQKLKFSLLFGLRFTTVMEFLTNHWCLVLSCPGSLKENVQVVTCLLMLTSYQNSAEHPVTFPGAMVFLEKKHYHPAPGHLGLKAHKFHYLVSASSLPVQKAETIFPLAPCCVSPAFGLSAPSSRSCLH